MYSILIMLRKKLKINRDEIIFINPCLNCYDKTHKFHNIASKFIFHKLVDYIKIIENATYNILSDSSFFCLAMNLEIKGDNNYYISRNNVDYGHLYSDKYIFKNINRKNFKKL